MTLFVTGENVGGVAKGERVIAAEIHQKGFYGRECVNWNWYYFDLEDLRHMDLPINQPLKEISDVNYVLLHDLAVRAGTLQNR